MDKIIPKYNGKCSRWLWKSEQEDIKILKNKYKELGYELTLSQSYDLWYKYCEYCCANWMYVDNDISKSLMFLDEVEE